MGISHHDEVFIFHFPKFFKLFSESGHFMIPECDSGSGSAGSSGDAGSGEGQSILNQLCHPDTIRWWK